MEGFELDQVKAEFSRLFSLAEEKTELIFSKGNVVIKKNVAEETAERFVTALERAGVAAHLLPVEETPPGNPLNFTDAPAAPTSAETPAAGMQGAEPFAAEASASAEAPALALSVEESAEPSTPAAAVESVATAATPAGGQPAAASPSQPLAQPASLPFSFHGRGGEYFRNWIVNILLTIVTLGIYSAWAKVRNAQYFHGHTELAGSRFAYLAKPLTILKGRLIAVAVFAIYTFVSNIYPIAGMLLLLLLIAALPWVVVRSLRFRRRMTAWRNIRFGFDGGQWPAAQAFILWPLAGVLTFGLLVPVALYKQSEFIINNTRYGTARLSLEPCARAFYKIYLLAAGILIGALLIGGVLNFLFAPLSMLLMAVVYLYLFAFVAVRTTNLLYGNTTLRQGRISFDSSWEDASYMKLVFVNTLMTLLTLGLFFPWAKVRVAAYKAEHLALVTDEELDAFVAAEEEQVSALGEEMGDVFDMEVGL